MTTKKALKKENEALRAELKTETRKRETETCFGNMRLGRIMELESQLKAAETELKTLREKARKLENALAAVKAVEAARAYYNAQKSNITEMEVQYNGN